MVDLPIWPVDVDNPSATVSEIDLSNLTYTDASGNEVPFPSIGYSKTKVVERSDGTVLDPEDYARDQVTGFTNPNLHRRVDIKDPPDPIPDPFYDPEDPESVDRSYLNKQIAPHDIEINIHGTHSYRTTTYHVHDEESITDETP